MTPVRFLACSVGQVICVHDIWPKLLDTVQIWAALIMAGIMLEPGGLHYKSTSNHTATLDAIHPGCAYVFYDIPVAPRSKNLYLSQVSSP